MFRVLWPEEQVLNLFDFVQFEYLNLLCCLESVSVCLDGSPPAYHLDRGSGAGINNWLIQIEVIKLIGLMLQYVIIKLILLHDLIVYLNPMIVFFPMIVFREEDGAIM